MNLYRMLGNLNSLLLGQYLMKTGLSITKKDLFEIQKSDTTLANKINRMKEENLSELYNFQLHQENLYKIKMIYHQKAYRLCLPQYLGREIYAKIHFNSDAHVTNDNLRAIFDAKQQ